MAEGIIISDESPPKRQKLLECILTGNSKLYLGKVCTVDQIKKLSNVEVEKLFHKLKLFKTL